MSNKLGKDVIRVQRVFPSDSYSWLQVEQFTWPYGRTESDLVVTTSARESITTIYSLLWRTRKRGLRERKFHDERETERARSLSQISHSMIIFFASPKKL